MDGPNDAAEEDVIAMLVIGAGVKKPLFQLSEQPVPVVNYLYLLYLLSQVAVALRQAPDDRGQQPDKIGVGFLHFL